MTQKTCNEAIHSCPFVFVYVSDCCKTQEICEKSCF